MSKSIHNNGDMVDKAKLYVVYEGVSDTYLIIYREAVSLFLYAIVEYCRYSKINAPSKVINMKWADDFA